MWTSPEKDCGSCGSKTCREFEARLKRGDAGYGDCPFSSVKCEDTVERGYHDYSGRDITGQPYDFVLTSLPNEMSARKIILPFRPDITERYDIIPGDLVLGRPAGAGCPIQHVIKVLISDHVTGVITGHVINPIFVREGRMKDIKEYHMIGFEGMASHASKEPEFGKRHSFLPGFCMMNRAHTGLVSMIIDRPQGIQVRLENIIIQ
jgi:Predicted Fe-S protein